MRIVIMDAQGGGIGRMLVEQLKAQRPEQELIVVGTNPLATQAMLKAGADRGASGENAVIVACRKADMILAPIGMLLADGMLGEVTPAMAVAFGASDCRKILIASGRCGVDVAGLQEMSTADYVKAAAASAVRYMGQQ